MGGHNSPGKAVLGSLWLLVAISVGMEGGARRGEPKPHSRLRQERPVTPLQDEGEWGPGS